MVSFAVSKKQRNRTVYEGRSDTQEGNIKDYCILICGGIRPPVLNVLEKNTYKI